MNHSLYQDGILKALPFKRLPCDTVPGDAEEFIPLPDEDKVVRYP